MSKPIPWECSYCNTVYENNEKMYLIKGNQWTGDSIMCIPCHEKSIIEYHKRMSYAETAQHFGITIEELKDKINDFNQKEKDPVFKHCDHHFTIIEILHKHGIEYSIFCSMCGLHESGDHRSLLKNHPNASIVVYIAKDCRDEHCQFCRS